MAVREASDQAREMMRVDLVDVGPLDPNQTHVKNFTTVDLISEIQRLELHFAIGKSWSDMPMKVERSNSTKKVGSHRGIVAHFLYAMWHHLSHSIS